MKASDASRPPIPAYSSNSAQELLQGALTGSSAIVLGAEPARPTRGGFSLWRALLGCGSREQLLLGYDKDKCLQVLLYHSITATNSPFRAAKETSPQALLQAWLERDAAACCIVEAAIRCSVQGIACETQLPLSPTSGAWSLVLPGCPNLEAPTAALLVRSCMWMPDGRTGGSTGGSGKHMGKGSRSGGAPRAAMRPAVLLLAVARGGGGHGPDAGVNGQKLGAGGLSFLVAAPREFRHVAAPRGDDVSFGRALRKLQEPAQEQCRQQDQATPSGQVARHPPSVCLDSLPCCVTVLQYPGRVLFQNPRSIAFFGDLTLSDRPLGAPLLHALMASAGAAVGDASATGSRALPGGQDGYAEGASEALRRRMLLVLERGEDFEAVVKVWPSTAVAQLLECKDVTPSGEEEYDGANDTCMFTGGGFLSPEGDTIPTADLIRSHKPDALEQALLGDLESGSRRAGGGGAIARLRGGSRVAGSCSGALVDARRMPPRVRGSSLDVEAPQEEGTPPWQHAAPGGAQTAGGVVGGVSVGRLAASTQPPSREVAAAVGRGLTSVTAEHVELGPRPIALLRHAGLSAPGMGSSDGPCCDACGRLAGSARSTPGPQAPSAVSTTDGLGAPSAFARAAGALGSMSAVSSTGVPTGLHTGAASQHGWAAAHQLPQRHAAASTPAESATEEQSLLSPYTSSGLPPPLELLNQAFPRLSIEIPVPAMSWQPRPGPGVTAGMLSPHVPAGTVDSVTKGPGPQLSEHVTHAGNAKQAAPRVVTAAQDLGTPTLGMETVLSAVTEECGSYLFSETHQAVERARTHDLPAVAAAATAVSGSTMQRILGAAAANASAKRRLLRRTSSNLSTASSGLVSRMPSAVGRTCAVPHKTGSGKSGFSRSVGDSANTASAEVCVAAGPPLPESLPRWPALARCGSMPSPSTQDRAAPLRAEGGSEGHVCGAHVAPGVELVQSPQSPLSEPPGALSNGTFSRLPTGVLSSACAGAVGMGVSVGAAAAAAALAGESRTGNSSLPFPPELLPACRANSVAIGVIQNARARAAADNAAPAKVPPQRLASTQLLVPGRRCALAGGGQRSPALPGSPLGAVTRQEQAQRRVRLDSSGRIQKLLTSFSQLQHPLPIQEHPMPGTSLALARMSSEQPRPLGPGCVPDAYIAASAQALAGPRSCRPWTDAPTSASIASRTTPVAVSARLRMPGGDGGVTTTLSNLPSAAGLSRSLQAPPGHLAARDGGGGGCAAVAEQSGEAACAADPGSGAPDSAYQRSSVPGSAGTAAASRHGQRPTYHRVHIAAARAGAEGGGGGGGSCSGEAGGGEAAEAGPRPLLLTVTQVDVSEQVEVQTHLARLLEQEHKVLESIFPRHVIEYMTLSNAASASAGKGGGKCGAGGLPRSGSLLHCPARSACKLASLATWHPCVTILFCDIVGFTSACHASSPLAVMTFLNELYRRFDALVDIFKVYKVETIGDCYMVAGGLVAHDEDGYRSVIPGAEDPLHALRVLEFAKAILRCAREVRLPHTGEPVQLRVGLHSGPVTSGVVGDRMPRFCLFGDTVNVASRMESTCRPGRIHASSATQSRLPREAWRDCGLTAVKGKGEMRTFEWDGAAESPLDQEQLTRVLGLYL